MVPPAVTGTYLWHGYVCWCVNGMPAPSLIQKLHFSLKKPDTGSLKPRLLTK
jgi:hypothetical protein